MAHPAFFGRGNCAGTDPDAFHPEKGVMPKAARKTCDNCEVKAECLAYAIPRPELKGIWGGMSERDRMKIRRKDRT